MELEALVDHLALQLGEPVLGDRGGGDVELALQHLGGAIVEEHLGGGRLRLEIGEDELGVLEVPDGLAERLALLDVFDRGIERPFYRAHRADRDYQPFLRQLAHQLVEPAPFLAAEHVVGGHEDIVEEQLTGVGRVHSDLVELLAAPEALRAVGLQAHQADALGTLGRVGLGDHDDEVRQLSAGDEGLGAVEAVTVPVLDRGRGDALQVRPRARLGHRDGADVFAAHQLGQPALLLLLGAVTHDVG